MPIQPAVGIGLTIVSVAVVFLLVPLLITLANLWPIWRESRSNGVLMLGVVLTTAVFFGLFFLVLFGVVFAPLQR